MIGLHQPDVNEEKKMIAIVRYLITYLVPTFLSFKKYQGQKWAGSKMSRVKNGLGQKWVGSKMGRVKNGLGQKWSGQKWSGQKWAGQK